jgi:hypothetical protein
MKIDLTSLYLKCLEWIILTPYMIVYNSKHKIIRIIGLLITIPWCICATWIASPLILIGALIVLISIA